MQSLEDGCQRGCYAADSEDDSGAVCGFGQTQLGQFTYGDTFAIKGVLAAPGPIAGASGNANRPAAHTASFSVRFTGNTRAISDVFGSDYSGEAKACCWVSLRTWEERGSASNASGDSFGTNAKGSFKQVW